MRKSFRKATTTLLGLLIMSCPLGAYPELQEYVKKHSNRSVNCALCHAHSDGPDGAAPGQIGGLSASEREKLGISRLAMDPGKKIDNPILNAFGNEIIHQIGRNKFLEIKKTPQHLDQVYSKESDLDHDGIPDIQEYYEGTHPLMPHDGNPWKLFKVNLLRNQMQIGLVILATIFGVWGFRSALIGFANSIKADEENDE